MRILELEINNIRGIRFLRLSPLGQTLVVWGPEGSGKSAVDFLLTGSILRLKGRGTGDISLDRHGHHVDQSPEDAKVWARVQLAGSDQAIEIQRSMAHPSNLECLDSHGPLLAPIMDVAQRGQHVLTRRDVLRSYREVPAGPIQPTARAATFLPPRRGSSAGPYRRDDKREVPPVVARIISLGFPYHARNYADAA